MQIYKSVESSYQHKYVVVILIMQFNKISFQFETFIHPIQIPIKSWHFKAWLNAIFLLRWIYLLHKGSSIVISSVIRMYILDSYMNISGKWAFSFETRSLMLKMWLRKSFINNSHIHKVRTAHCAAMQSKKRYVNALLYYHPTCLLFPLNEYQ